MAWQKFATWLLYLLIEKEIQENNNAEECQHKPVEDNQLNDRKKTT